MNRNDWTEDRTDDRQNDSRIDPKVERRRLLRAMSVAPIGSGLPGSCLLGIGAGVGLFLPAASLAATPRCSGHAEDPTPRQTEGPYFTPNSPRRASLLEPRMPGTRLVLSGRVWAADCTALPAVLLDFWQADASGDYDNRAYRLRGHQYSDEHGRYRLETVVPGIYPGRTRHIHVKVQATNGAVLTTQLYFPGETRNRTDGIFSPALLVSVAQLAPEQSAPMHASFDFVLPTAS